MRTNFIDKDKMEKTNFENLKVYQLSENLADSIWKIVVKWNSFAKDTLGKQLVNATDSIGANLAEGIGRYSVVDTRRFVRISRGSLYETKHWLRRAYKRDLLNDKEIEFLLPIIDELTIVLAGYLRSLTRQVNKNKLESLGENK